MGRHSVFVVLVLVAVLIKGGTASRVGGVTADRTFNLRKLLTGQSCDAAADYALVLDSSGSLQATGYAQLKNAALQILSATTNAANRYYCNQFASSLNTIMTGWGNEATAQTALNSANWLNSRTNMVAGLSDALAKLQQPSPNSVKLCFLITDGEPNEGGGPADVAAVATSIKALAGVKLITIGVGPSVNAAFLTSIASPGSYYPVGSTADLVAQIKDIVYRACPLVCEAPQQFTLSTTGDSCTLPLCTPALVSSGAQCYSVYKSGSQNGIVTQTPDSITALAGGFTEQDIVAKSGSDQQCTGRVKLTCIKAECRYPSDCNSKLPDLMCATKVCNAGYCDYKPKMRGSSCNDTNPCTLYDKCDGSNIGEDACHGTDKSCATQLPPNPYYKSCYDTPYCDVNTGGCVWPYNSAALNSIISANAYCGTWAGAFATQLVSNNTTPNPSGSTSYADCFAACTADVCAKAVPACSCTATAGSSSRASAGTCPPCPMTIPDATWCAGMTCNAGQYTVPSDGSHPNATCWYPDPNVKNGAGGYLYPCAGSVFTEYSLTGGTSVSQCMGCLALGSAYDNKSSTCYAGQIAIPVDP